MIASAQCNMIPCVELMVRPTVMRVVPDVNKLRLHMQVNVNLVSHECVIEDIHEKYVE